MSKLFKAVFSIFSPPVAKPKILAPAAEVHSEAALEAASQQSKANRNKAKHRATVLTGGAGLADDSNAVEIRRKQLLGA